MTMILGRTGSTLGDYEELTSFDEQLVSRHTPARDVSDLGLREVLAGFDIALAEPMAPLRSFIVTHTDATGASISYVGHGAVASFVVGLLSTTMHHTFRLLTVVATPARPIGVASEKPPVVAESGLASGAADVVAAIKGLAWRLGLPQRDVCEAADVSRSAYYTWNQPEARRPRVASQGRLWSLVQFTEDLEELLDVPTSQWLLADPGRREQLLDGRFDDLLESLQAQPRPRQTAPDYARFLSVGGDRLASDAEPAALHRKPGKITSAQTVSPSRPRTK
jgi:hypothetical protein